MPNDEMKPIRDAIQEFYGKTGIRITDMSIEWTSCVGTSDVVKVQIRGEQP